jgi:hypothetical protein
LSLIIIGLNACDGKSVEERLSGIDINEESYKILTPCEQINIFAEIGSEYLDIDHGDVLMPSWMYQEIKDNPTDINSDCIERELLNYFSLIEQSPNSYQDTSLKIHSLFYLSETLGLLKDPGINDLLKDAVCEEKILYSRIFLLTYYFTQHKDLPAYVSNSTHEDLPKNMEKLKVDICEN